MSFAVSDWIVSARARKSWDSSSSAASSEAIVEAVPALRGEHAGGDQIVDGANQDLERMMLGHFVFGAFRMSRMSGVGGVGVGEGGPEQAGLGESEVDVALPGRAEPGDRALVLGSLVGHRTQSRNHCVGQP